MRILIVHRSPFVVRHPIHRVILMQILRMRRQKLLSLRPQRRYRLGVVVKINCKAVGFVVICHVSEDVVIDVAEEVNFWLDPPVVAGGCKGRVFVEHAAVPAAHLVVGDDIAVLYVLFFEHCGRFIEEGVVDP